MYWTGLPFVHGEIWRVSPYAQSRNRLEWTALGRTFASTETHAQLIDACLNLRPRGGRIYIAETGSIWMNVPDGGLAAKHRERLQNLQQRQLIDLKNAGRAATLRLLRERIEATGARPLYVGRVAEFDDGRPPWTAFESTPPTPEAGEDV